MSGLENIKTKVKDMSALALKMWQLTHRAFMEHNLGLFPEIMSEENRLNELEKEVTEELARLGKGHLGAEERNKAVIYAEVAEDLELIGDYCKDILERIEIKIEEKLLFSEDAVKEYNQLCDKTKDALEEVVFALAKDNPALVKEVLRKQEHIDSLVDEYRRRHNQRLLDGLCSPFTCNMFLNMLDFTAAVYYHTKKIAKNLSKIKNE